MDTLTATGLAVAIAGVAAYSFYRYRNALTLRVTASQWAVINRALLLARSNPLVGLEIARQLDGHARQIALQGLAPLLVAAGYRQEGLQALGELEKNNLPQPLKEVVELLLDQGDHLAAQALLDQTGVLMPVDGHIALMKLRFAKGDKDGALQILKMIGSVQTQSGADLVSAHDSLRIAPLQRQFGQTECAAMSIAWAWINAREADGSLAPKKLRALLHEFYLQDGATRVIELAQQLHASEKAIAASVLFEFGDLEPAMTLLGEAGKHLPHDAYEQLQRQALAADELDKAERLIELAPAYEHHELLLGLMNWHAKMSKSATGKGTIWLMDDPKVAAKRIKSAVTDAGTDIVFDRENKPGVANLLTIFSALTGQSIEALEAEYADKQYGNLKVDLAGVVVDFLTPFQAKVDQYLSDPAELDRLLARGAAKAREIASVTLSRVYDRVGLLPAAGPAL